MNALHVTLPQPKKLESGPQENVVKSHITVGMYQPNSLQTTFPSSPAKHRDNVKWVLLLVEHIIRA